MLAAGFDELQKWSLGLTLSSRLLSEREAGGPTSVSKQTVIPPQYLPHSDLLAYSALAQGGCAAFLTCCSSHLPVRGGEKKDIYEKQTNEKNAQLNKHTHKKNNNVTADSTI